MENPPSGAREGSDRRQGEGAPDGGRAAPPRVERSSRRNRRLRVLLSLGALLWLGVFGTSMVLEQFQPPATRIIVTGQQRFAAGTPGSVAIHTFNGVDGQPLSAEISAVLLDPASGKGLADSKCFAGDDGRATCNFTPPMDAPSRIVLRLKAKTRYRTETFDWPIELWRPYRLTLSTDRTLYDSGQPIQMRVQARHPATAAPVGDLPVVFRVCDRRGIFLMQQTARTSPHGVAAMELPTGPYFPSGPLLIEAVVQSAPPSPDAPPPAPGRPGRNIARAAVQISPPAQDMDGRPLHLTLTSDKPAYRPGQQAAIAVELTDDVGMGVAGGHVRLITTTNQYDLKLDHHGRATQSIAALAPVGTGSATPGPQQVLVRAEGRRNGNGPAATARLVLPISANPIVLLATSGHRQHVAGGQVRLGVLARDPAGLAMPDVQLSVQGRTMAVTDADGVGQLVFPPGQLDDLPLIQVVGRAGLPDAVPVELTVPLSWSAAGREYEMSADPLVLPQSGQVKVKLRGLAAGERVMLELLSGRQVLTAAMWEADGDGRVERVLEVPENVWGLLRLVSYRFDAWAGQAGSVSAVVAPHESWLWVSRPLQQLQVQLRADKHTYRPGDRGRLFVRVLDDQGKPVQQAVAVSLRGVDEATWTGQGERNRPARRESLLAAIGAPPHAAALFDTYRHWMSPGLWQGRSRNQSPAAEQAFWLEALRGGLISSQWQGRSIEQVVDEDRTSLDLSKATADLVDRQWHQWDSGPQREQRYRKLNRKWQPLLIIGYCLLASLMLIAAAGATRRNAGRVGILVILLYVVAAAVLAGGVLRLRTNPWPPLVDDGQRTLSLGGDDEASRPPGDPQGDDIPPVTDPRVSRLIDQLLILPADAESPGRASPDAFLWMPEVLTDDNGRLDYPMSMPSTVGNWRVDAEVFSDDGRRGQLDLALRTGNALTLAIGPGRAGVASRQLPTLQTGELLRLAVVAANHSTRDQRIFLNLDRGTAEGRLQLVGDAEQAVTVAAGATGTVAYDLAALQPGQYTLRVTAQTGPDVRPGLYADREIVLSVIARPGQTLCNRVLLADERPTEVEMPSAQKAFDRVTLDLAADATAVLEQAAEATDSHLGGRLEHWAARLAVGSALLERLDREGASLGRMARWRDEVAGAYARLIDFRTPEGAWSESAGGEPSTEATATAVGVLARLNDRSWRIDRRLLDAALLWLRRAQQQGHWQTGGVHPLWTPEQRELASAVLTAQVCRAMADAGADPVHVDDALRWLTERVQEHPEQVLLGATAAHALVACGRSVEASVMARDLARRVRMDVSSEGMWFEPGSAAGDVGLNLLGGRVAATALMAWALERTGQEADIVRRCRRWLMLNRSPQGDWDADMTTMIAATSLADYTLPGEPPQAGGRAVNLWLVESNPVTVSVDAATGRGSLDVTGLAGEGVTRLALSADAGAPIYAALRATRPHEPETSEDGLSVALSPADLAPGQKALVELKAARLPDSDWGWTVAIVLPAGLEANPTGLMLAASGPRLRGLVQKGARLEFDLAPGNQAESGLSLSLPVVARWTGRFQPIVALVRTGNQASPWITATSGAITIVASGEELPPLPSPTIPPPLPATRPEPPTSQPAATQPTTRPTSDGPSSTAVLEFE